MFEEQSVAYLRGFPSWSGAECCFYFKKQCQWLCFSCKTECQSCMLSLLEGSNGAIKHDSFVKG